MNKIAFDCVGFSTASVFVVKNNCQYQIGFIKNDFRETEFSYFGMWYNGQHPEHLRHDEVPTPEQVVDEYRKQFMEKGVFINREIRYAG